MLPLLFSCVAGCYRCGIGVYTYMGLVDLHAAEDGRSKIIQMTVKGLNTYRSVGPLWEKIQTEIADKLAQENPGVLNAQLTQLTSQKIATQA